jgi:tetratricopeptide (TPR) repeat protein
MPIPIPAESYPLLIDLINQTYLDRVEQITAAQLESGGAVKVVAIDGSKRLAISISDNDLAIKLMGAPPKASPQFAGSGTGKKFKCGFSSISCGLRCITASKVCRKELTPKQLQILNSLRQLAKQGSPVAEKQITAIRVGQLNKTRLANEKVKKAAMDDVERIIYESKQAMKASQDASRRLVDETNAHMKDLDEFISEHKDFMGSLPDAKRMQDAANALQQAMEENEQGKLDQAKKAIDKALSQHIDDLSIDDLDASDEMLKNSLKTMLGDERGTLEWQRITDETKEAYEEYKKSIGGDKPPRKPKGKSRKDSTADSDTGKDYHVDNEEPPSKPKSTKQPRK